MPISLLGNVNNPKSKILEKGWLLYSKPTTLEPVGTLFRIDKAKRRFIVDQVVVETQAGAESGVRVQQRVQADIGFFARFLGIDSYRGKLGARDTETLEFEILNPEREFTSDASMDKALAPVLTELKYRTGHHYYVIRETRSATAMTYRLTHAQLGEIGGEASLAVAIGAGANIAAGQGGLYEINQVFPARMRVMFLAEEIAPLKAGLAGDTPSLGRRAVRHPLTWTEG
jgi:hypothetical protein